MDKYIERDECRDNFYASVLSILSEDSTNDRANQIIDEFDTLPSADVEPVVHAKWIPQYVNRFGLTNIFVCSECNKTVHTIRKLYKSSYLYCPNCGAKMKGEENNA